MSIQKWVAILAISASILAVAPSAAMFQASMTKVAEAISIP